MTRNSETLTSLRLFLPKSFSALDLHFPLFQELSSEMTGQCGLLLASKEVTQLMCQFFGK